MMLPFVFTSGATHPSVFTFAIFCADCMTISYLEKKELFSPYELLDMCIFGGNTSFPFQIPLITHPSTVIIIIIIVVSLFLACLSSIVVSLF